MKRPFARLLLFAASAVALTGCATFTDADIAARVGDEELTTDQLASFARDAIGDDDAGRADMQTVAGVLTNWVIDQVVRADLAANGTPLPRVEGDPTIETLTTSFNESVGLWQQLPPAPVDDDAVRSLYSLGPVESNMICPAHVLVGDAATANEVLDLLGGGAQFADVAAEYSFDGSAGDGGNLPCSTTGDFATQYIPEFVEATVDAEIDVPVGPVESQFGFHVIVIRPYDDIGSGELLNVLSTPQIRFDFASTAVDVYVDPRYGSFNGASGVIPLG